MSASQIFDNRTDPVKTGNGKVNQANDRIIVARNGKEFGPYTYDVAMRYLHAGSLVHRDTARLQADNSWRDLASILGVPSLPPKTVPARSEARLANLALLFGILSWTIILSFLAIPAVIFGHKALVEARLHPNKLGRDRAIAGLVFGYILIVALIVGSSSLLIFGRQLTQSIALDDLEKHPQLLPTTAVLVSDVRIFHWWHQKTLSKGTEVTVVSVERARNQLQIRYEDQPFSVPLDATDVISRIAANSDKLREDEKAAAREVERAVRKVKEEANCESGAVGDCFLIKGASMSLEDAYRQGASDRGELIDRMTQIYMAKGNDARIARTVATASFNDVKWQSTKEMTSNARDKGIPEDIIVSHNRGFLGE